MKQLLSSLTILSLAFLLASCGNSKSEADLLREVMAEQMTGRTFVESVDDGRVIFTQDGDNYQLAGSYKYSGEYLVLEVAEMSDMYTGYLVGVFADNDGWKTLFTTNLKAGRLDTIMDLNGDHVAEIIVEEYEGDSEGFNSNHVLYASVVEGGYSRIGDLYRESEGSMMFVYDRATIQYEPSETGIDIVVDTEHSDTENWSGKPEEPPAVKTSHITFRWQPPDLVRDEAMGDMSVAGDGRSDEDKLAEAQSMIDMLNDYERKNELLVIKYYMTSPSTGVHNDLYFDGYLSELTFRDYEMTGEDGVQDIMHLEFLNNAVVRGTKRIAGQYEEGILTYVKDWQNVTVATELQSVADNLQEETPIADDPGGHIHASDIYYTFDPAKDEHIAFIRENAALFTPGWRYKYEVDGRKYEVDSLLWVREFSNK